MGDLLGQADLMFTRKEETDRPQAGVVGRAALWVIVYLIWGGQVFREQSAAIATDQPELHSTDMG